MPQTRRRPAGKTGRGGSTCGTVRAGQAHDTPADHAAVDRLPASVRARYLAARARWRTIHDHHRALVRLLAVRP